MDSYYSDLIYWTIVVHVLMEMIGWFYSSTYWLVGLSENTASLRSTNQEDWFNKAWIKKNYVLGYKTGVFISDSSFSPLNTG